MSSNMVQYTKYTDVELFEGQFQRHSFPWHYHDSYTLILVEEGAVEYIFANNRLTVHSNEAILVNPFLAHYNREAHPQGWKCKVFFLPIGLFNSPSQTLCYFTTAVLQDRAVYNELLRLHTELKESTDNESAELILQRVSQLIFVNYPNTLKKVERDPRIIQVMNYIEQHLDEKMTAKNLANLVGLSSFYFQRMFKACSGLAVNAYIQQKRMEASRVLLQRGTSLVATALETGYFDQSHFHHQFKRMYGLTPRQFGTYSTFLQEKRIIQK